jgi:hypothetical protein
MEEKKKEEATRYNEGKIRYDLIDDYALEQMAKVLTKGAEKYEEENWRKGMKWSKAEASLKRHLAAYKEGEDFDHETGLYHLSHAMVNLMFMVNYYRTHPEYDDRRKSYLTQPKITLDIDEVVCKWQAGYSARFDCAIDPRYWNQSYVLPANLALVKEEKDFWVNLEAQNHPDFEPHAYVSSRSIPVEWTQEFIVKNGLPAAPVYHVPFGESKIAVLKEIGSEIHIDDSFRNFKECEENGITAFLMDAPHNQHYNVGYRRIKDLKIRNIIR